MKILHTILLALALLLATTSCQNRPTGQIDLSVVADSPLARSAFDLGFKLGTYKGLQQNPEFIPLAEAIANTLESASATDGLIDFINTQLIPAWVSDPVEQEIARELVATFAELYRAQVDAALRSDYLPILAANIRSGVQMARLNPDA